MGVTVDRSQGKQGENDKSQQDESYFKVREGQLHELLLLRLGKSVKVYSSDGLGQGTALNRVVKSLTQEDTRSWSNWLSNFGG